MLRIKVKDKSVRALIGHLAFTGNRATAGLRRAVLRQTMKVQAAAQKLTPADGDVSLRRSAQSDVTMLGDSKILATVTFGGLAEAYAEVQHENEDFAHTEAAWSAKHGRPFPDRVMTERLYRGQFVTRKGETTYRRFKGGELRNRRRKHRITGYTGGQAHFLHGADNSAWDTGGRAEADMNKVVQAALEAEYQKAVSRGGID